MAASANDAGGDILGAMQSMKSIMGKEKGSSNSTFPEPPVDFVGTPTVRVRTKKSNKMNKKYSKPSVKLSSKPPSSSTNDLFSNLTNPSKMLPAGVKSQTGNKKDPRKNPNNKNQMKKYRSNVKSTMSDSSMSSTSSMSSGSRSSRSSRSTSSRSSRSSVSGSELSGSSVSSEEFVNRRRLEKKKRQDEIMQEKVEMITRISNLTKNGFSSTKKWNMKDDIDEVRYECYRLQRESNTKKSIKMMRQVLVSITTMIEMGNAYFNPFNLRLEGFSKNMMLSLSDYDDCFDQLHHKYSGRSSVGPEMQIMFTFMSAAVFHHAGNAISQKEEPKSKSSMSSPMSSMMGMMGMLGGLGGGVGGSNKVPTTTNNTTPFSTSSMKEPGRKTSEYVSEEEPDKPKRRKMKGPGVPSIPTGIIGSMAPPASSVTSTMPSMTIPQS